MSDALKTDEIDENGRYTYADYLKWEGPQRYQLINGEAYQMASPSVAHQALLMGLSLNFGNWLAGKPCKVFAAPLDVRLFPKKDKSDNTVVQPDLLVVCDNSKLDKDSVNGPPDLVIEIVSPTNTHSELFLKFQYYLKAGVREYWVIDPDKKMVQVHIYENGHYISALYSDSEVIPVNILSGLEIKLENLWNRIA
ncbi:MAG: Uma2 family endonuclease [Treponema sp.]|jgi:Uma2 family endonuclease|nr:Uma2 family endonuclease [Treponema sp.]